jgi:hypothetical protein
LLITSNAAGVQQDNFIIEPAMLENLDEPTGTAYTTGALIEKGTQRMLIVADTTMVSDSFLQNTAENQTFLANAVDWVAADEVLASIPKRTSERMVFTFASKSTAAAVQYGNILMPPLAVALFGGWWLKRRKKLAMRQYAAEK